ncbi:hypothetical protein [Dasania marina]|uniref:hypothetical protein n=1 Tax=Dasania marina TaxID=471499 RepID=UPI00037DE4AC|nr:hypothetical protein [Dasania marina]
MNWESAGLLILIFVGYFHLLRVSQKRSIIGIVKLHIEAREQDKNLRLANKNEIFTKSCPFIVTPVPGMEYMPADIEGGEIKRVLIDDQGLLEVTCHLVIPSKDNQYQQACEHLVAQGWYKQNHV